MRRTDYTNRLLQERYLVLRLLGEGGMGAVYLAQHNVIGKKVAVKFLHAEFAENKEVVKRFYREAQAAAAISHKNIIDIFDVGISEEGEPFLVMEYLEGESLSSMLERSGPISLPAACAVLEPVLQALGAAHNAGIIHRDLKPDNIFIVQNPDSAPEIKLIDFGISKIKSADISGLTGTGMFLGTPAYTSPEQIRGAKDIDCRTDLYSVGVILYQMLTGDLPFKGEHTNALLVSVLENEPIPPRDAYSEFPIEAESIVARLLCKNSVERPSSTAHLLYDLRQLTGFEQRNSQLETYTAGLEQSTFASGDLGPSIAKRSGGQAAADVLTSLAGKNTPTAWATTTFRGLKRRRYKILKWIAAAIIPTTIVAAVWMSTGVRDSRNANGQTTIVQPVPATAQVAPSLPVPKTIRIRVDAPNDATVFFDGVLKNSRTFEVSASDVPKELKVSAPGRRDYTQKILPSQNQLIRVALTPIVETEPVAKKSVKPHSARRTRPAREKTAGSAPSASKPIDLAEENKSDDESDEMKMIETF